MSRLRVGGGVRPYPLILSWSQLPSEKVKPDFVIKGFKPFKHGGRYYMTSDSGSAMFVVPIDKKTYDLLKKKAKVK